MGLLLLVYTICIDSLHLIFPLLVRLTISGIGLVHALCQVYIPVADATVTYTIGARQLFSCTQIRLQ